MTDPKTVLLQLNKNLNTLREREAKYAGNAPVELLNQIDDHKKAIDLTRQVITCELTEQEWWEALKPLLLAFSNGQVVNIEAEVYVGGNVGGDIVYGNKVTTYIYKSQTLLSPTELTIQGKNYLKSGAYQEVINIFKQVLGQNPKCVNAHYYIALALLEGKRPRLLPFSIIQEIEKRLRMATMQGSSCSHCFVLWAIVKEDYYVINGLYVKPPSPSQLLQQVSSIEKFHLVEILTHIHAPGNRIWESLHKFQ